MVSIIHIGIIIQWVFGEKEFTAKEDAYLIFNGHTYVLIREAKSTIGQL